MQNGTLAYRVVRNQIFAIKKKSGTMQGDVKKKELYCYSSRMFGFRYDDHFTFCRRKSVSGRLERRRRDRCELKEEGVAARRPILSSSTHSAPLPPPDVLHNFPGRHTLKNT